MRLILVYGVKYAIKYVLKALASFLNLQSLTLIQICSMMWDVGVIRPGVLLWNFFYAYKYGNNNDNHYMRIYVGCQKCT